MQDKQSEHYLPEKTILLLLRESAMTNRSEQYRETARTCADQLDKAISKFAADPTYDNLIDVNGLFALGHRIMEKLQPSDDPSGKGGAQVITQWDRLHAVAA